MATREYGAEGLTILWDSSRCIHTGRCLRALPEVFDTGQRPWVQPGSEEAAVLIAAIEQCPTGALRYRLDGSDEPVGRGEEPVSVMPAPNGPLFVRGPVRVETRSGTVLAEEDRVALCRCGASRNQPFCDLSHKQVGFRDNPQIVPDYRREAANPDEVDTAGS